MDTLGNLFFTTAVALLGFTILYLVLKRKIERVSDASYLVGKIREEIDQIVVELNQTTDRNIALIEDRIHNLNELLSKADKKIGLLKREAEKHEVSTNVYQNVVAGAKRTEERNRQEEVLSLHAEGLPVPAIANRLGLPISEVELIVSLNAKKR